MSIRPLAPILIATSLVSAALAAPAAWSSAAVPSRARASTVAAAASTSPTIDDVITLVAGRNPKMSTYVAHAVLDVRQLNFPYLHPVLQGTEYFTKPGFTVFDYPHTPFYMKGITKVQGSFSNAPRWPKCFNISMNVLPNQYLMHMEPKVRGEISAIDVFVGRTDGTLDHVDWYYWENPSDHVRLTQHYTLVNGNSVVTSQDSEFTLHHIRARGSQTFSDFQFNVAVPTPAPTPSDPLHQCDNPE